MRRPLRPRCRSHGRATRGREQSLAVARSRLQVLLCLAVPAWLLLACALAVVTTPVASYQALAAGASASDAWLLDRDGQPLQHLRLDRQRRQAEWMPLAAFSPTLVPAVLAAEDHRFLRHAGVDPLALGAVLREVMAGRRLRGASTLTMQLASVLARQRNDDERAGSGALSRKLAQVRDALAIERRWSKAQILEAYLNLVPMRGELAGVPAAALGLLGKGAGDLDVAESAVLAAAIRAPSARTSVLSRRACRLLHERGRDADCEEAGAIADALPRTPLPLPGVEEAPHLARQLLHSPGERVRCSVDGGLQRFVADALRNRLAELEGRNVADGAVIVLDNASGEVLAYVGSGGDWSSAGQVDGVLALRQPGSTLKPFLYGIALSRGWLDAASIVQDAPFTLATPAGLYAPQDYEHDYRGPVSLRTALASSLNTPAVRTLDLVGVDRFVDTLHALGFASLRRDPRDYGVGLALGDGDVTLLELANAYRALANGGRWMPVTMKAGAGAASRPAAGVTAGATASATAARQVFPPATAFILGDILADPAARAPTFGLASPLAPGMWAAVKTGTSKGMRDNWTLGWTDRYTIGVWVGNFSGAPMWDVSGMTGAAPLWRDIVVHLQAQAPSRAPAVPSGVRRQQVQFVPAIEPPRREWFVASAQDPSAAPASRGESAPAAAERSMRRVVLQPAASLPRLLSPADQSILAPDPDIPERLQQLLVDAQGPPDACLRFDGQPLARCGVMRRMLKLPAPGHHELQLLAADGGELAHSGFEVRGLVAPAPPRRP